MIIGPETYEKSISSACIQLAQAYSITKRININDAKILVENYLKSLIKSVDNNNENNYIKDEIIQSLKNCETDKSKAYYELLKLREKFD